MSVIQGKPYIGLRRRLIIAFDIGTTFSGVSYMLLVPGEPPVIQGVTQFPGQHKISGDSKIPSVVCYDEDGDVIAVGSETDPEMNPELTEIKGLVRAEWFKLHLRPSHLVAEQRFDIEDIPPLPSNKAVIDIFADLLRYLYQSTNQYIRERQGNDIWESVSTNIEFVLSHPNGWEGRQQSDMRYAAIEAGLVEDEDEALKHINFVTEGEASLHFCLNKIPTALENCTNEGIIVVDCGGGTIDISTYAQSSSGKFREIAPTECLLQGSIFVTRRARAFLTEKLGGSEYGKPEDIDAMTRYFDKTTKPNFNGPSKPYFIRFGRNENDPQFDIRSGSIKIDGKQIAEFFEPAVQSIIQIIEAQSRSSVAPIRVVFIVGGFATSDYLSSKLDEHFKIGNVKILRPDAYLSKAVAEGAISFHIKHLVTSRVSRYTYGTDYCPVFNPKHPDHVSRAHTCIVKPSGGRWIPNGFSRILLKDTEVPEEREFRRSFFTEYTQKAFRALSTKEVTIKCYRDRKNGAPAWIDTTPERFVDLCVVIADMSGVKKSIRPRANPKSGAVYYHLYFDVVLLFGLTELKAQIAWKENGHEKRGPATIVYDSPATKEAPETPNLLVRK
ncbi:hypothetical protein AX15_002039 [Amanita polypyramis BW_CC]|nr:hypothetical protein AX15_002039 [Amanita polypyramis BW_CC]